MAIFSTPRAGAPLTLTAPVLARIMTDPQAANTPVTPTTTSTSASKEGSVGLLPETRFGVAAFAIFIIALVVAAFVLPQTGPTFTPVEGVGVFAVFYVVAQAAERGVELITPLFNQFTRLNKEKAAKDRDWDVAKAKTSAHALAGIHSDKQITDDAAAAADSQAKLAQVVVNRRAVAFSLAAAMGMLLCGYLHADFLTATGVNFGPRTAGVAILQLAVTGLIVGGGSDGLHGLVSNISKANAKKDDPEETGGAS